MVGAHRHTGRRAGHHRRSWGHHEAGRGRDHQRREQRHAWRRRCPRRDPSRWCPAILRDCIERFPNGLATGDAGWTTAGDLPAQWVIHTVGPNYNAGQRDRSLLKSCYRRALEVADELGARSVAFPLISTGVYGWPRRDAIAAAIETIAAADTRVEAARLVAFEPEAYEEVRAQLTS